MIVQDIGIGLLLVSDKGLGPVHIGEDFIERLDTTDVAIADAEACWMRQVHGTKVVSVTEAQVVDACDGLITQRSNLLLITRTADCVPLLMWDDRRKTVAAVHAGRKGVLAGIVTSALAAFEQMGSRVSDLKAFLGPHLRTPHHEISADIAQQVPSDISHDCIRQKNGVLYFDLTNGVVQTLIRAGMRSGNILDCDMDTYNSGDYFSYRKMKQGGNPESETHRFASAILLRD